MNKSFTLFEKCELNCSHFSKNPEHNFVHIFSKNGTCTDNESNFNDILIQSELFSQEYNDSFKQDILLTILSVIDENNDLSFVENKNFLDQRPMPSRYLLDKINYASEISSIKIIQRIFF